MKTGKVWLVGAGPGDPGLLTVKAVDIIKKADVIVYDALIGDALFSLFPREAEYISVGKRAGNHTMPQEKIDQLLLDEAQKGRRVVRLKGGDPFLFGRGGEELELLADAGIPYEIIPGITSPIAVPAYNGIPVTHRDFTSSLHIITGHKRKGSTEDIDFEALVRTEGTLVFLMGIARLSYICRGLMDGGMGPDMPAAVLQQGTTASQKRIVATVGTLVDACQRQGVETPAIIIVGRVCTLADRFAWFEKLPLAGSRVIVTRPRGTISRMAARLRELGAEVLELPSIETVARTDQALLGEALDRAESYDWLVFTSPTGVRVFFDALRTFGKDIRSLAGAKIAAIGTGTRKELTDRHLIVDFMPSVYDGDTLGKELAERVEPGSRILLPRAAIGNQNLTQELRDAGAEVDDIPIYDTVDEPRKLVDEKALFETGKIDCAVFTSASTVRGFVNRNPGLDHSLVRAACIGKQTRKCAEDFGMQTWMADEATIDSLVQLVISMKGM